MPTKKDRRLFHFSPAVLGLVIAALTSTAKATPPTLQEAIAAQRSTVRVEQGRMAGPGAAQLRAAVQGTQFVFIGEDHGISEIADFSAALFTELAGQGYSTLAVENGPAVASKLDKVLRGNAPLQAIGAFKREYPFALAFYDLQPEAEFLVRIAKAAGPAFKLFGFDQELMGASKYLLEQIAREPINPAAKASVRALLAREESAYQQAAGSGNPMQLFMMAANMDELRALHAALTRPNEGRARALLNSLMESRDIYDKSMNGQGYVSNIQRALLMKRLVAEQLRIDPSQKMLFKAGATHAMRGYNVLGSREIGNYLAEHAEGRGQKSLNILVLALSGKQSKFDGIGRPPAEADVEPINAQHIFAGVIPLFASAEQSKEWSLFDLRPLRRGGPIAGQPQLQTLVQAFDFALVIPATTAARALP